MPETGKNRTDKRQSNSKIKKLMATNINFFNLILILFIFFEQAQLGQGKAPPQSRSLFIGLAHSSCRLPLLWWCSQLR
jgi:hypothetical protein